jgi:Flp pilus assembly protein TadD
MNVANELRAAFSAEEQARIERPPTDSPVAYELYLQALYLTGVGNQAPRMQQLLDAAIGADPKFAGAYGAKALLYATELINTTVGSARSPEVLEPLIAQNVSTALSLDPESMTALQARTSLSLVYWRWTEVQSALERLYEITGSSQFNGTWFWSWSGNEAEALRVAEREVDLNPRSWGAHLTHGFVLNYAKNYAAAVSAFREAISASPTLAPTYASLAIPEVARGNLEEARRALVTAEELLGQNRNIITLLDIATGTAVSAISMTHGNWSAK